LFLALAYQFERNRLTQIFRSTGDGYVLPGCWRPDHPTWRKLEGAARSRGIDPVRYIRWSLTVAQVGLPPVIPEPNRLLERKRMDLYEDDLPKVRREIELRFVIEMRKAETELVVHEKGFGMEPERAQVAVLADGEHMELSPLCCYMLALAFGTERLLRLAGQLERDALFQFSKNPEENAAVYGARGRLPAGFAARAAQLYARVVEEYATRA
jgi:hypothetical protein